MKKVLFMLLAISAIAYAVPESPGSQSKKPYDEGKTITSFTPENAAGKMETSATIDVDIRAVVKGPGSSLVITDGKTQINGINFFHMLVTDIDGDVVAADSNIKDTIRIYAESDYIKSGDGGFSSAFAKGGSYELVGPGNPINGTLSATPLGLENNSTVGGTHRKPYDIVSTITDTTGLASGVYNGTDTLNIIFTK